MTTEQPIPPIPTYSAQMGVVFASFQDGSIWFQNGPERWQFVRKIEGWGVPCPDDTPDEDVKKEQAMDSIPQRIAIGGTDLYLCEMYRDILGRYWTEIQADYEPGDVTFDLFLRRVLSEAIIAKGVEYRLKDAGESALVRAIDEIPF